MKTFVRGEGVKYINLCDTCGVDICDFDFADRDRMCINCSWYYFDFEKTIKKVLMGSDNGNIDVD